MSNPAKKLAVLCDPACEDTPYAVDDLPGHTSKLSSSSSPPSSSSTYSSSSVAQSKQSNSRSDHIFSTMIAGGVAGTVSKTAMAPLSRLTILYQVDSALHPSQSTSSNGKVSPKVLNISQLTNLIIREEGFLSLWKGNFTSVLHRFPYSAINFSVYERSKDLLKRVYQSDETMGIRFACGALGGASACIACYPLDIIRTRLTINPSKVHVTAINSSPPSGKPASGIVYTNDSILGNLEYIVRTEGVRGLYRGLLVSLSVCVPNLAVGFSAYGTVKERILNSKYDMLKNEKHDGLNMFGAMLSGASSGIVSSLLVFPADVIRRRMQVRGLTSSAVTARQTVRISDEVLQLWRIEGIRGFYRGISPELIKVTPSVGITFCVYELVLQLMNKRQT